jgi:hypothetical protein
VFLLLTQTHRLSALLLGNVKIDTH